MRTKAESEVVLLLFALEKLIGHRAWPVICREFVTRKAGAGMELIQPQSHEHLLRGICSLHPPAVKF